MDHSSAAVRGMARQLAVTERIEPVDLICAAPEWLPSSSQCSQPDRRLTAGVCVVLSVWSLPMCRADCNRQWLTDFHLNRRRQHEFGTVAGQEEKMRTSTNRVVVGPRQWRKGEQRDGTGSLGSVPRRRAYRIPQPRSGGSGYRHRCSGADIRQRLGTYWHGKGRCPSDWAGYSRPSQRGGSDLVEGLNELLPPGLAQFRYPQWPGTPVAATRHL